MPMMPMGAPMPEEQAMAMGGGVGPEGPIPAAPGMGPGPMMDEPEPALEEVAMMLGAGLEQERAQMHAMVDQAADQKLEGVLAMIAQAGQGAQVMGPGEIA